MEKTILLLLMTLIISEACRSEKSRQATLSEKDGYTLFWQDEFGDEGKPDSAHWSYE